MTDFNKKIDRRQSKVRKWDKHLIQNKYHLGDDAIPMDIADLDFECAPAIKQALIERSMLGDFGYSYTYDEYYDAIIHWNKRRFNIELKKEWIQLTFGTCGTLHYIIQTFCSPHNAVMINTPAYAPFADAVFHGDCRLIKNPLKLVNMRYYFDFELMEQQFIEHQVKAFILCSPQNPSGRVWTKEELYQLSELCLKYNVLLISDEIHRDIIHKGTTFVSLWNAHPNIKDLSIVCVSPNKGFNLGGLKSSYVTIANPQIRIQFQDYLKRVYVTSPHVFVIPALIAAYNESEDWLDELGDYIEENFNLAYSWFETHMPKAKVMKADSSFLIWVNIEDVFEDEIALTNFFQKAAVTMVPGSYFVDHGQGWVRLNLGTQKEVLKTVFNRFEALLQMQYKHP